VRVRRGRHRLAAAWLAVVGLCGLAASGFGLYRQLAPRVFTAAQRQQIQAWEVASRWRTLPKARIFPAVIRYRLPGAQLGSPGALPLTARLLEIDSQASCAQGAGVGAAVRSLLRADGCQAMLRATYSDASSSMVLTVGVGVLRSAAAAASAARAVAGGAAPGSWPLRARHLMPAPFAVAGTPAALFGFRQRQLSWVRAAGPYLIVAAVGYADGRPRVPVSTDAYTLLEMTSMARGVIAAVAAPLGAPAPVPHCPDPTDPAC